MVFFTCHWYHILSDDNIQLIVEGVILLLGAIHRKYESPTSPGPTYLPTLGIHPEISFPHH
jgi:hypothetical protein